jgi:hypothetical protein
MDAHIKAGWAQFLLKQIDFTLEMALEMDERPQNSPQFFKT